MFLFWLFVVFVIGFGVYAGVRARRYTHHRPSVSPHKPAADPSNGHDDTGFGEGLT